MGKETFIVCNVDVPTNYAAGQLYDYENVTSAQHLWGTATTYTAAKPLNPETNGISGQDLFIGQGIIYNDRLPIPLRTYYWRMRGYCSFDTKPIGNLISSGYEFVSCVLKVTPEDVYVDSDWNLRIYYDSNRGGLFKASDSNLNPAYHPNETYTRSGYNYILQSDILDLIEEDADYYDFIDLWRIEANWDWNGACFNQKLIELNISDNFVSQECTYIDVPLWSINTSGRTDYKFCSVEEMNNDTNGMISTLTNLQFMTVYGTNVSLDFTFYGMRLLRLTDISLCKYIQGLFDNSGFVTIMSSGVKDAYPEHPDDLVLPSVIVEHTNTGYSGVQIGGEYRNYDREFGLEFFGAYSGLVSDMVELVVSGLKSTIKIPIYDYNQGFDIGESNIPIIAYLEVIDIDQYPSANRDLHKNLKNAQSILLKTKTLTVDPDFDKFYLNVPVEEFIDMAGD